MRRAHGPAWMAAIAIALAANQASAEEPASKESKETTLELGLSGGFVPTATKVNASGLPAPGSATPTVPFATGSDSLGTSGFAVSGRFTLETPFYGPGIFRAFFLGGATMFFGRSASSTFGAFHSSTPDTGATVQRSLAFELAIGGNFPLCDSPACSDLRVFLGMSVVRQSLKGSSDETAIGGKKEETSGDELKWGPLFGASFTTPLCSQCSRDSLRLELGVMTRSIGSTAFGFTSGTGRIYVMNVESNFEAQLHAGLLLPLL